MKVVVNRLIVSTVWQGPIRAALLSYKILSLDIVAFYNIVIIFIQIVDFTRGLHCAGGHFSDEK